MGVSMTDNVKNWCFLWCMWRGGKDNSYMIGPNGNKNKKQQMERCRRNLQCYTSKHTVDMIFFMNEPALLTKKLLIVFQANTSFKTSARKYNQQLLIISSNSREKEAQSHIL